MHLGLGPIREALGHDYSQQALTGCERARVNDHPPPPPPPAPGTSVRGLPVPNDACYDTASQQKESNEGGQQQGRGNQHGNLAGFALSTCMALQQQIPAS